ncbi:Krueppel like proteinous protein 1 [Fusarium oxysporum f. sp. cubense race 1]|uniref:Krueppel like proteinous protein 1 n=1 Tax=Fusarium oxysporum f. sp. cubense (strain race 1) TaxID=1229664 RepID=N4U692_FUSC1|nr:Krueppel like proteinous protein 1 [Fusarium oxysporum f. sp. cubense race 1]
MSDNVLKIDNTTHLNEVQKRAISAQDEVVIAAADACINAQIELLNSLDSPKSWVDLPLEVQNALSIAVPGSNDLSIRLEEGIRLLKLAPKQTSNAAQSASTERAINGRRHSQPQLSASSTSSRVPLKRKDENSLLSGGNSSGPGPFKQSRLDAFVKPVSGRAGLKNLPVQRTSDQLSHLPAKSPALPEIDGTYQDVDFEDVDDEPANIQLVDNDTGLQPIQEGVIDDQGFIRIGPQPMKLQDHVRSAPEGLADVLLKEKIRDNHRFTDAKFPGADSSLLKRASISLFEQLQESFTKYMESHVTFLCDYTGLPMSWSPGPHSPSLECILPVVLFENQLAYHAPPNVCLVMSFLNWAKRQHIPIVLPLVAVWLKTWDSESAFESRKGRLAWAFTALSNAAILTQAFHIVGSHKNRLNLWDTWSPSTQREVLEILRTGNVGPKLWDELQGENIQSFYRAVWRFPAEKLQERTTDVIYDNLLRIAQSYDLSVSEFEYYCTVPSPHFPQKRVFYPFYILSKPQAQQSNWDWPVMLKLAKEMLFNMRKFCNKHAEQAGHGEKHMNDIRLVYWMAMDLCRQIKGIKVSRPTATREEIAFSILDRWCLPRVPWKLHMFKASLCKKQDHGIAMVFGVTDVPDDKLFDPLQHIDLDLATVTIDSVFTNMAMKDFPTATWPTLRLTATHVPLHHPFWAVSPSLGNALWVGDWDSSIVPEAPRPEFEIDLLSIEAWVDGHPRDPFKCGKCTKNFSSAGQLLEHHRCSHGLQNTRDLPELFGPDQDAVDKAYWDQRSLKCPYCDYVSPVQVHMDKHVATHTGEQPCVCDHPGCTFKTASPSNLATHKMTHTGERNHKCDYHGCTFTSISSSNLTVHKRQQHTKEKPHKCDWPGCDYGTAHSPSLTIHKMKHTGEKPYKCDVPGCEFATTSQGNLNNHKRNKHKIGNPGKAS